MPVTSFENQRTRILTIRESMSVKKNVTHTRFENQLNDVVYDKTEAGMNLRWVLQW